MPTSPHGHMVGILARRLDRRLEFIREQRAAQCLRAAEELTQYGNGYEPVRIFERC